MREVAVVFRSIACVIGLAACGSHVDNPIGDAPGNDVPSGDVPSGDAPSGDAPPSDSSSSPEFVSCIGLPSSCGATGHDSCCNSPAVPGGRYFRSFDLAGDSLSGNPDFPATVSDFRLDRYEVTVGRFRVFVNAGMGTQANPPRPIKDGAHESILGSGWDARWNVLLPADKAALIATVKCDPTLQT